MRNFFRSNDSIPAHLVGGLEGLCQNNHVSRAEERQVGGIPNVDKNRRLVANLRGKTAITMILTSESFGMGGGGIIWKGNVNKEI